MSYTIYNQEVELEFPNLARAVSRLLRIGGGNLTDNDTEQTVQVQYQNDRVRVRHVTHPISEGEGPRVFRKYEGPLLRLVANQVKRFTGMPVVIRDSLVRDTLI